MSHTLPGMADVNRKRGNLHLCEKFVTEKYDGYHITHYCDFIYTELAAAMLAVWLELPALS